LHGEKFTTIKIVRDVSAGILNSIDMSLKIIEIKMPTSAHYYKIFNYYVHGFGEKREKSRKSCILSFMIDLPVSWRVLAERLTVKLSLLKIQSVALLLPHADQGFSFSRCQVVKYVRFSCQVF